MYSLGIFNEGGGSFAAAMRYLGPAFSLVVAVVLIQDYIFTIVVSTLSGVEQLLSLRNAMGIPWYWHFLIGAVLVLSTWYLTIRGRGESARVVFTMLGIFIALTIVMAIGLFLAKGHARGCASLPTRTINPVPPDSRVPHADGLDERPGGAERAGSHVQRHPVRDRRGYQDRQMGKEAHAALERSLELLQRQIRALVALCRLPSCSMAASRRLSWLTLRSTSTPSMVSREGHWSATCPFIGFNQIPGGIILYWAYQILAVALLASASMTAYQDLQAMAWRNVAIGEIPEVVVYRNPKGTFTRPVTAAAIAALVIMLLVRGRLSLAVPYYGVGVFLPIMAMGLAIRQHIRKTATGRKRMWGSLGASLAAGLAGLVFIGQIAGKWTEGGWVVLISLGLLVLMAHAILISPIGYRTPRDIHRIIRDKSRIQGQMGNIVEWQSLRVQEYRYRLLGSIAKFWELFGVRRPMRFEPPVAAGDFSVAMEHNESGTFLDQHINGKHAPKNRPLAPSQEILPCEPGRTNENNPQQELMKG